MKKILIATDFSEAANNATAFGAALADIFQAEVILFNAYESMPVPVSEVPVVIMQEETALHLQRELTETARILKTRHKIAVHTCLKAGHATHGILEAIKEHNADMLVMGMKSSGKERRRFFGSTVTGLIRKTRTAVLVIPEDVQFSHITKIALATETDLAPDANTWVLDALKQLAERFESKVYMVRVATKDKEVFEKSNYPFQLGKRLRSLDTEYKCVYGDNFFETMNSFLRKYRINMLAMMPLHHTALERWFIGSTTRTMTFESSVPLLILPEKQ